MNISVVNTGRLVWAALRMLLVLTAVTGIAYPLAVTGIAYPLAVTGVAQGLFHDRANGSIVRVEGKDVDSALVGQTWNIDGTDEPDPRWFQPRPSNSD